MSRLTLSSLLSVLSLLSACSGPAAETPPTTTPTDPVEAEPAPDPEPPERAMVGHYKQAHTVWMVCDDPDGCDAEVDDRLSIAEAADKALAVDIGLVQTNGHTCTFEGTLAHQPTADQPERWQWVASAGADGHPCEVTLAFIDGGLRLTSEGCRYYCGARAYLDASFPYPPNASAPEGGNRSRP